MPKKRRKSTVERQLEAAITLLEKRTRAQKNLVIAKQRLLVPKNGFYTLLYLLRAAYLGGKIDAFQEAWARVSLGMSRQDEKEWKALGKTIVHVLSIFGSP